MSEMTTYGNPGKTGVPRPVGRLRAPFETLDVSQALDVCKALLRGRHPKAAYQAGAARLTRLEDWLEVTHPRLPRESLRAVRRRLEDRSGVG